MYEKELKDKKQGAQPGMDIVVSALPLTRSVENHLFWVLN